MQRVRIGIIGAGTLIEWGLLPVLTGPDAVAPLDTGSWWSRRPSASGDIRYQPPAVPEVVAICDPSSGGATHRVEALAHQARVPATYTDWRRMLRETPLDAVFVGGDEPSGALQARPDAEEVGKALAAAPRPNKGLTKRWLWLDGVPDTNSEQLERLAANLDARGVGLWMARPLRMAAAHRTASRLVERDSIGHVTALQLRWPWPLDDAHSAGAYAAMDLLLSFIGGGHGVPVQALVSRHPEGAASLWFTLAGGATATVLAASADTWNSPLPRLEVCGTQGRHIVCEGGRRVHLLLPREGTRTWEPPGMAAHVTSANTMGLGEDVKAFLANAAEAGEAGYGLDTEGALRAVALLDAIVRSRKSGVVEEVRLRPSGGSARSESRPFSSASAENLTLNLA